MRLLAMSYSYLLTPIHTIGILKWWKATSNIPFFYANNIIYHYTILPLGLINASATYQRMFNNLFVGMIDITMEAYMDDMLVTSVKGVNHFEDLRKTFECMRFHQVRLNLAKCSFGVHSGRVLRYMVSQRGITLNSEKV